MDPDPSRISVTAKIAAYYRQFSDIPFAADAARALGADAAFEEILREHGLQRDQLTFYAPMFEARYKSVTALVLASGAPQVLDLASGYSLRGLDLTRRGSIRYVEVDLPDVVATKRALLDELRERHGIAPTPAHVLAAANVLDLDQVRAATAVLDRGQSLVVLCEGLIQYLSRDEIGRLASHVRALLGEFAAGAWMTADFSFEAEARALPPERVRLRQAITGVTQRRLDAAVFEDAADLEAFLHRFGFEVEVRSQVDETPSFASIGALGLSPAVVERMRAGLRVWIMRLARTGGGRSVR
jgi:O-methyltransferase involved in polyketide biosynthesis